MSLQTFQNHTQAAKGAPETRIGRTDTEGFVVADTASSLLNWETTTAALAMWRRTPLTDVVRAIDRLPLNTIESWRLSTDSNALEADVRKALSSCGLKHEGLQRYFASDMFQLGRVFVAGTGHQKFEVRFEVVKGDACRRFHTDGYPERLAVTYRGPGTVAVPRGYAKNALQEQQDYDGPILEVPRFWAALFAGETNDRAGLVHRSPRIAGTGKARLFFCVNAAKN